MTKRLLIDGRQTEETRVVLLSGTRIEDFDYETENRKQLKGNVYLARVTRVEPSLQAAFVEYGGNRQGFLAFSEIHPDYYRIPVEDREALIEADEANNDDEGLEANTDDEPETLGGEGADEDDILPKRQVKKYKIQEVISRKQIMLVQVVKEERGNKGAALTTYLSLAGRYCVLMPNNNRGGGVSRKITNMVDRKRLKTVVGGLDIQDGMAVIVRTAGAKRTKTEITRDFNYLSKLWDDIRALTLESQAPCMIHEEGDLIKRSIRDLYTNEVDEVLVEGEEAYKVARNQMKMLIPSHLKKVKRYEGTQPIFQHFDAENQMDTIHSPHVTLKSGGYLVINQTEALVAIDVNSGKSTRERNIEETALKTNLEAAEELGRQLRLRDLSGLIVVDFIDMEENRNQHAVERRMKDAMRSDRARIQIGSISHFGLLEMSRQRLRLSINESTSNLCPHCEGTGRIRSIDTAALQLLRSIEEEAQKGKMDGLHITAHREVVLFILNQKRSAIAEIENRFGLTVVLLTDDSLIAPEYKVDRFGWQGRPPSKQSSGQAQKIKQDNKNLVTDSSDPEGEETGANISEFQSDDKEAGTEDGNPKRRRRGRRGGRRRRRRNEECGQADENLSSPVQSNEPIASQLPNQQSSETPNVDHDHQDKETAQVKPSRGRRHRRRPAKSDVGNTRALGSDAANESTLDNAEAAGSNISALDEAKKERATNPKTALPKKSASNRKKTATSSKTNAKVKDTESGLTNADQDPSVDSPVAKAKKPAKKVTRSHKSKDEPVAPDDQPADKKRVAAKKPVRKAAKKAASKSAAKAGAKAIDEIRPEVSKTKTSREPVSSAPQDVIKIGNNGTKSPRRGWWSRT
ncbi:MAG: ribonuclease E/G [Candidatus Puniceispirillaceae bacterium]